MTIGEIIKQNRISKGMTQAELAQAVGVSEISIRKYEHGDRNPKFETIVNFAKVFGMSVNDFIDMVRTVNDDPEIVQHLQKLYFTNLKIISEFLSDNSIPVLSQQEKDNFIQEIDDCLDKTEALTDNHEGDAFISQEEVSITHKIFQAIMQPYQDQEIFDIIQILSYYLMLNRSGKTLVQNLLKGLSGNKDLVQKTYDPNEERPEETDMLFF